jgi:hypothetical protein
MGRKPTEAERAALYYSRRPHPRSLILRDVAVLQLKLLIGNVHNFLLMPVCLLAGALDILFKNRRDEALLYKTLAWGRHFEDRIGLYGALEGDPHNPPEKYSIDAVVARIETAIRQDYENGGTTATMKAAANKALSRMSAGAARLRHKQRPDQDTDRTGPSP